MFQKLDEVEKKYEELTVKISDPEEMAMQIMIANNKSK